LTQTWFSIDSIDDPNSSDEEYEQKLEEASIRCPKRVAVPSSQNQNADNAGDADELGDTAAHTEDFFEDYSIPEYDDQEETQT